MRESCCSSDIVSMGVRCIRIVETTAIVNTTQVPSGTVLQPAGRQHGALPDGRAPGAVPHPQLPRDAGQLRKPASEPHRSDPGADMPQRQSAKQGSLNLASSHDALSFAECLAFSLCQQRAGACSLGMQRVAKQTIETRCLPPGVSRTRELLSHRPPCLIPSSSPWQFL